MYRTGRILGNTMVAKRAYPQSFPVGQETQWEAVAFLAVFWKKMLFDDKVVAGGSHFPQNFSLQSKQFVISFV